MASKTKRSKVSNLYIQSEANYGVDPTGADSGASLVYVPTEKLSYIKDGLRTLRVQKADGKNRTFPSEVGPDGAELSFEVPAIGLPTAAGDGVSPPAVDWFDLLLANFFGASSSIAGKNFTAAAAGTVTAAGAAFGLQDVIPVSDPTVNSGYLQWRRSNSAASVYTIAPNFAATPTSGVLYGTRRYTREGVETEGASLTAYYQLDGLNFILTGGRITSFKIHGTAGERIMVQITIRFDAKAEITRASAPTLDGPHLNSPQAIRCYAGTHLMWGPTQLELKDFDLEFRANAVDAESALSPNGRNDIEVRSINPLLTINPYLPDTALIADFRAQTKRMGILQMGSGVLASGIVNGMAFASEAMQVMEQPGIADDKDALRQSIKLETVDSGIYTGTTYSRYYQLLRA